MELNLHKHDMQMRYHHK